ncbi:D-glycero-alpha-D-manno-heptose-1,7-bisphosphate 7-phosphatase [Azohydromonas caseinilytica]|uniref:D,D-heptose 1,7-bisphosphate phosphatase n=1 Tax=Azohydromonas caseinilytica TaxID=2728836 RepID=A0A848F1I4_9BURK|nr:HAD family hydrolase [Azohydromonas caseinilytica]NML13544.1 HAD family hydrolase [Azohydromonas caseinilytica]
MRPDGAAAPRPAVFLDKDGTLIEDVPYSADPARLRFTPRALAALQRLRDAGYALVVISNQPGLALGYFSAAEFGTLRRALQERLLREAGVRLDGFYFCPHAPEAGCACRKPAPGLLLRAAAELRLDLARSWMVGDILNDVEAGQRAGCRGLLLDVGHETLWQFTPLRRPRHRAKDLHDAARFILENDDMSFATQAHTGAAAGTGRMSGVAA